MADLWGKTRVQRMAEAAAEAFVTARRCPRCKEEKPLEAFGRGNHSPAGFQGYCRPCMNAYRREQHAKHPEDPDTIYLRHARRTYGITPAEYQVMFTAQGGVCAICGKAPNGHRLSVDHDHASGKVRALLCNPCNVALGGFSTVGLLEKAITYLKKWDSTDVL